MNLSSKFLLVRGHPFIAGLFCILVTLGASAQTAAPASLRISMLDYALLHKFPREIKFENSDLKSYVQDLRDKKDLEASMLSSLSEVDDDISQSLPALRQVYFETFGAIYFILNGKRLIDMTDEELDLISPVFSDPAFATLKLAMAKLKADSGFQDEFNASLDKLDKFQKNEPDRKVHAHDEMKVFSQPSLTVYHYVAPAAKTE